jgi:hypothetical protein
VTHVGELLHDGGGMTREREKRGITKRKKREGNTGGETKGEKRREMKK